MFMKSSACTALSKRLVSIGVKSISIGGSARVKGIEKELLRQRIGEDE